MSRPLGKSGSKLCINVYAMLRIMMFRLWDRLSQAIWLMREDHLRRLNDYADKQTSRYSND